MVQLAPKRVAISIGYRRWCSNLNFNQYLLTLILPTHHHPYTTSPCIYKPSEYSVVL